MSNVLLSLLPYSPLYRGVHGMLIVLKLLTYFKFEFVFHSITMFRRHFSDVFTTRVYASDSVGSKRDDLDAAIDDYPEYLPSADRSVLGAFGCYGNPASFHDVFARGIRMDV